MSRSIAFEYNLSSRNSGAIVIQNKRQLEAFYRRLDAQENLSHRESLAIYEMLHNEAVSLGAIHSGNMLDGIAINVKIARIINRIAL
jgi:hypothetical protein